MLFCTSEKEKKDIEQRVTRKGMLKHYSTLEAFIHVQSAYINDSRDSSQIKCPGNHTHRYETGGNFGVRKRGHNASRNLSCMQSPMGGSPNEYPKSIAGRISL